MLVTSISDWEGGRYLPPADILNKIFMAIAAENGKRKSRIVCPFTSKTRGGGGGGGGGGGALGLILLSLGEELLDLPWSQ